MNGSSSLHRSETQKEFEDQHYLDRLIRSQKLIARKENVPAPIYIPRGTTTTTTNTTSNVFTASTPLNYPLPSTSTASVNAPPTGSTNVPYLHPSAESPDKQQMEVIEETAPYIHPCNESPRDDQTPTSFDTDSERQTMLSGSTTDVAVIYNPFESPINRIFANTAANSNPFNSYSSFNSSRAGILGGSSEHIFTPVGHNTQINHNNFNRYSLGTTSTASVFNSRTGEGLAYGGDSSRYSALNEMPSHNNNRRSPQAVRNSELFYQQQLIRSSQQEHNNHGHHQLPQQQHGYQEPYQVGQDGAWGEQWRRLSKKIYGNRVSSLAPVTTTAIATTEPVVGRNQSKNKRDSASNEPLLDMIDGQKNENDSQRQDEEDVSRRLDRPSCCIPLGFMSAFIYLVMLAYNGVLSAFVYQASRFPSDTNLPVFVLSIVFIFSAALSLFGIIATLILYRSKSKTRTSRAPHLIFKAFHLLSLMTSSLTSLAMVGGWLVLNYIQTGELDKMYLKTTTRTTNMIPELSFESFLTQDVSHPDYWILNIKIWIPSFAAIWIVQIYFWSCLRAYGKKVENRRKFLERRKLLMTIDTQEC
ncbi:hypothetical protein BGZ46_004175 [Entomortierella lignicola]|nr:hypothetical protein BGZ46_004175 [Entomortierella lignicola]